MDDPKPKLSEREDDRQAKLKPYQRERHPPGCPDSDWCSGNGVCYWNCECDGDSDD